MNHLRRLDPVHVIIALGVLVRIDTVIRFDPLLGYDAPDHVKMMGFFAQGIIPRVDLNWEAQHPPLFYLLALVFSTIGFGVKGGQVVSLLAGTARLLIGDHLLRRLLPEGGGRVRLFANVLHAFLPVAIRMDSFFNPESLGATMSLAAVALALSGRSVTTGLVLGGALLSKASAVAAVPAVGLAFLLGPGGVLGASGLSGAAGATSEEASRVRLTMPTMASLKPLAIAWVLGAGILMIWGWQNVVTYHTPYPPAQIRYTDPAWSAPLKDRHEAKYYRPRFDRSTLWYPFYVADITIPSTLIVDAWGDYYNFSNRGILHGASKELAANGRRLGAPRLAIHVILAYLGLILTTALAAGMLGAATRLARRRISRDELVLAVHAAGYLTIMLTYAIWHPVEGEGPVKAAYGMGASTMLVYWTGRALAKLSEVRYMRGVVYGLLAAVALCVIAIRVVW